jgi:hypothetical protein
MRLVDPRMVTTVIPDDDRNEATLRYCAELMCKGRRVLVLDIPALIPDAVMPSLVDKLNEVTRDAAGQVRHHLDTHVTASLTRS